MIAIRPALPDATDAPAFANLADIASAHLYHAVLGRRSQTLLDGMFRLEGNHFSHRHVRFITLDGEIAGMICGLSSADAQIHARRHSLLLLRFLSWRLPLVLARCWPLRRLGEFVSQTHEGHFYVPFLAVYEKFRGRGFGLKLMAAAETMAREAGCSTLALSADPTDPIALRIYQKFGMSAIRSSPTVRFRGRDETLQRMEKPLA